MTKGTAKLLLGIFIVLSLCCLGMFFLVRLMENSSETTSSQNMRAQKKALTPEQRVDMALKDTNIEHVKTQLSQIPVGTAGRDSVENHLKDLDPSSTVARDFHRISLRKSLINLNVTFFCEENLVPQITVAHLTDRSY